MLTFEQLARENYESSIKSALAQCEHILKTVNTDEMRLRHLAEMASSIEYHAAAARKECRRAERFARKNGITGVW